MQTGQRCISDESATDRRPEKHSLLRTSADRNAQTDVTVCYAERAKLAVRCGFLGVRGDG